MKRFITLLAAAGLVAALSMVATGVLAGGQKDSSAKAQVATTTAAPASATPSPSFARPAVAQSKQLAVSLTQRAPADSDRTLPNAAAVIAEVQRIAPTLPLPAGGSLSGGHFEKAVNGDTANGVEVVAEYNAACSWWRDARDNGTNDQNLAVMDSIGRWPQFRGSDGQPVADRIAAAARAGDLEPLQQQISLNCR